MRLSGVYYEYLFIASLFLSIIAPIFPGHTGGMMYHVLFISLIPCLLLPFVFRINHNFLLYCLLLFYSFLFLTSLSVLYNSESDFASFLSGLKIVYFFAYILMGYVFSIESRDSPGQFLKLYYYLVIVAFLVALIELYAPSISHFLYKRENSKILEDKLTSLFNTTYHLAFFLFWGYLYSVVAFFNNALHRTTIKKTVMSLSIIIFMFALIAMTQSRIFTLTSILFLILKTVQYVILKFRSPKVIFLVTLFCAALASTVSYYFEEISEKLGYLINGIIFLFSGGLDFTGGGIGSFNTRINQIFYSLEQISSNPLFGAGVGKDIYLETIYAYLLYKYGLLGTILYFLITLAIVVATYRLMRKTSRKQHYLFFNTCFWFFMLSPIYFLGGPLFEVPKLSMFFFCLIGIIFGLYYKEHREHFYR